MIGSGRFSGVAGFLRFMAWVPVFLRNRHRSRSHAAKGGGRTGVRNRNTGTGQPCGCPARPPLKAGCRRKKSAHGCGACAPVLTGFSRPTADCAAVGRVCIGLARCASAGKVARSRSLSPARAAVVVPGGPAESVAPAGHSTACPCLASAQVSAPNSDASLSNADSSARSSISSASISDRRFIAPGSETGSGKGQSSIRPMASETARLISSRNMQ